MDLLRFYIKHHKHEHDMAYKIFHTMFILYMLSMTIIIRSHVHIVIVDSQCHIHRKWFLDAYEPYTSYKLTCQIQVWRLRNGKGNYLVFCRKGEPKEQLYSRSYLVWAMGQNWIRCSSCWATGAIALEMEKIKHHQSKSSKLLRDANVAWK